MSTLIIDSNNIAYKNLFSQMNPEEDHDFSLWRHKFLSNIIDIMVEFSPTEIIMAIDAKNSWRYDIYPHYKSKRKEFKEDSKVDFEKFYPVFDEFIKDIKKYFTSFKVIQIDRVEGDDIIAILSKHINKLINENTECIIM